MMQRAAISILPATGAVVNGQQQRGMATLKAISIRLKSVKNIQKITQSMKMVSAAKYARAERDLRACRPYGEGSKQFFEKAEVAPVAGEESKKLILAMTSDRGLCGAVHTGVARFIRGELAADPSIKVICVGDKSRAILSRLYAQNILLACNEVSLRVHKLI
jgi:F-type H+-transporting ATPase subunit gamma